jgi:hypothetical protein
MKEFVCQIVLWFLCRGMDVLARKDERVKKEIASLPEGYRVCLKAGMKKGSPQIIMTVTKGRVLRTKTEEKADLTIVFKNIHTAFKVFTGQMGIAEAYAGHGFYLKGNINIAMGVVRCMEYVELYLFPKIISSRILKRVEKKQLPALEVYARAVFERSSAK